MGNEGFEWIEDENQMEKKKKKILFELFFFLIASYVNCGGGL